MQQAPAIFKYLFHHFAGFLMTIAEFVLYFGTASRTALDHQIVNNYPQFIRFMGFIVLFCTNWTGGTLFPMILIALLAQ